MATGKKAAGASISDAPGGSVSAAEPGVGAGASSRSAHQATETTVRAHAAAPGPADRTLAPAGVVLLIALIVTWGLNWPMMKLALAEVPPWTFRTMCLMVGGSVLLALTRGSGARMTIPRARLPALLLVSLFNITGWHLFSAYAVLHTGSGRAAIIGYTMPLWASLLSIWVLRTRPTGRQGAALVLGMGALALLVAQDLGVAGATPTGALLMLGAAICWAIGTVLVKKFAWDGLAVTALTGWQQLLGGLPILVGWWLLEPVPDLAALSLPAALGLVYVVFVATVFCHAAYFKLLSLMPAHVAAISVLPVPVVGVVSSALLLGEPVGPAEVAALALVVGGLFLLIRSTER
jgi:drug/metabolite transporter (DMT)-like permease